MRGVGTPRRAGAPCLLAHFFRGHVNGWAGHHSIHVRRGRTPHRRRQRADNWRLPHSHLLRCDAAIERSCRAAKITTKVRHFLCRQTELKKKKVYLYPWYIYQKRYSRGEKRGGNIRGLGSGWGTPHTLLVHPIIFCISPGKQL